MRSQKRGGPPALPPEEAAVTYSRIDDADELPQFGGDPLDDDGRREPTFEARRVDPPRSRRTTARVDLDDFEDRPISLDPEALGATAGRPPRRRRSPVLRVVLLVGALAVLGGIGMLGATVLKVLYGPQATATATAPASETATPTTDATAVRVATPTSVLPESGSAGPGILALPASDGGPVDMTPAAPDSQPQAALQPEPSPTPIAPQPAARPEPAAKATASAELPPLPKPAPVDSTAASGIAPSADADIDSALSDVDRLLAEKKAQATAQPQPQTALAAPADQSAALNLTPQPATELPPLPAPKSTIDPSIPVPPADIPNPGN